MCNKSYCIFFGIGRTICKLIQYVKVNICSIESTVLFAILSNNSGLGNWWMKANFKRSICFRCLIYVFYCLLPVCTSAFIHHYHQMQLMLRHWQNDCSLNIYRWCISIIIISIFQFVMDFRYYRTSISVFSKSYRWDLIGLNCIKFLLTSFEINPIKKLPWQWFIFWT